MFRDTFAVEMLLAGVPIEEVSMLLGHASIKTTEKHYAPWVLARQEKLENSVRKSWEKHGVLEPDQQLGTASRNTSSSVEVSAPDSNEPPSQTLAASSQLTLDLGANGSIPIL